jgi:ABC-type phosphate/phosphonate transport system substrate-binding protein
MPALGDSRARAFQDALFRMSWEVPAHRRLLELEGLKQWLPPRETGYESLVMALDESGGW